VDSRPFSRLLLAGLAVGLGTFSLLVSATVENALAARPLPERPLPMPVVVPEVEAEPPRPALLAAVVAPRRRVRTDCATLSHEELSRMIAEASERHELSSVLLVRVVLQESGGRPCAVSPKGAVGLMGLMPGTARYLRVLATNPEENIDGGARYLKMMLARYGNDFRLALAAYNAGPGRVDQYGGVPPFAETRRYVARVLGE
jgi:soluble lytic murein transglycosylase-like protein